MAQNFPEFTQLQATYLLELESKIGQNSPVNNKAFLRIIAKILAMIAVLLRVEVISATKENLAITASLAGLKLIGQEYDTPYNDEVSTVLTATLPATTGTTIPANVNFTADDTGILYYTNTEVTAAAGVATLSLTCRTPGAVGNLSAPQTLKMAIQIAGAEQTATVTAVTTTGADAEETETYRQRVLDKIRAPGGGFNFADGRNWGQEQEGVERIFPYSGNPTFLATGSGATSSGDVSLFVEAQTSIDPDGIAPTSLLDDTKDTVITDPDTGLHRIPIGFPIAYLYVASITRTALYTKITGAVFLSGTEAQVKSDIDDAMDQYFLSLDPFIAGLDVLDDRNDKVTSLSISEVVQQILQANGASATGVAFGDMPGTFLPSYQLAAGEKAKNGGVTYV